MCNSMQMRQARCGVVIRTLPHAIRIQPTYSLNKRTECKVPTERDKLLNENELCENP